MLVLAVYAVVFVFVFSLFAHAYAFDSPVIILHSTFLDTQGRINVVGTVRNYASIPVQVMVGVETDDGKTMKASTYGRVIRPLTDSPFKFVLNRGVNSSDPFILDVREVKVPNYNNMLFLNYGSMAVGEERAFVGTIKNVGPTEVHNVSVYAGIHSLDHKSQLDTVRSNVISGIKPGEEVKFIAFPDPAIRQDVFFYSCAGVDYDAPINTITTGDGGFIPFNLNAVAQISSLRYEDSTDSIAFGVMPYAPYGDELNLQIPQYSKYQTVTVLMDGEPHDATVRGNGKTMYIDFFVPQGAHQVQIQGVSNVPEFPIGVPILTVFTAGIVVLARYKAAFKIR
jgi:hypothetical protein